MAYRITQNKTGKGQFLDSPLSVCMPTFAGLFLENNQMKTIPLTQNKVALVDDEDFEWLNQFKWYASKQRNDYIAVRHCRCRFVERRYMIYMHRQIMSCPQDKQIDHINHNRLDNQRCNLRICTNAENHRNSKKIKNTTSTYKGVSWQRQNKKWQVKIKLNSKDIYLGCFDSEIKAAQIYDQAAQKYFGEFACTNF